MAIGLSAGSPRRFFFPCFSLALLFSIFDYAAAEEREETKRAEISRRSNEETATSFVLLTNPSRRLCAFAVRASRCISYLTIARTDRTGTVREAMKVHPASRHPPPRTCAPLLLSHAVASIEDAIAESLLDISRSTDAPLLFLVQFSLKPVIEADI